MKDEKDPAGHDEQRASEDHVTPAPQTITRLYATNLLSTQHQVLGRLETRLETLCVLVCTPSMQLVCTPSTQIYLCNRTIQERRLIRYTL